MRLVIDLQGAQGSSHTRGIGRYSRELAAAMVREPRGHEVIVALSEVFAETAEELSGTFCEILPREAVRTWASPGGTAAAAGSPLRPFAETLRAQFLASLRPDLVHVCSLFEGLVDDNVTLQPTHLERLPVVATCYDLIPLIQHLRYFGPGSTMTQGSAWYYRCVHEMSLSEGLLAISESSRREAVEHIPYPPERVFNVQAGISADFRPARLSAAERGSLLQRYGLDGSFILFLGAGDPRKNEAGLVRAYALLPREQRARHQLLIVGGVDEAGLRQLAEQSGIDADRFVIAPFVREADLNALYSTCALFVFPSFHEGFGLPLAEAMACGAPAVASNTTSLPEVIGRADATFDPADPVDIAACMQRVLDDPGLRSELAAYGPERAARFTWRASAARAWDALEEIHEARRRRGAGRTTAILQPRKSLAFVSPLPPQATGIADYSAELLPSLARHYDITVVSQAETDDVRLASAFPRLDPDAFLRQAGRFDRVLYQIGNSDFHRFQTDCLLPRRPGVVVLHDAFLSGYMNWRAHVDGRPDDFRAVLLHSHGYPALEYEAAHGREAAMMRYPCSLPVLESAVGVIQHSRHAVEVLERHFGPKGAASVYVIPLLRAARKRMSRQEARAALGVPDEVFVVGTFGHVAASKRPELVAEAWRRSGLSGRLVFAGLAQPEMHKDLTDPAAGIEVTGRLTPAQYDAWIAAADVAMQLRSGSRGESSGSVGDVLVAGLPLIVNRHGAAVELPDDVVHAVPDDADAHVLAQALVALHDDGARRAELSANARSYARRELSPELMAERYREAIERAYAAHGPASVTESMRTQAAAAASPTGGLAAAAKALARTFPSPWRGGGLRRLMVDVSGLLNGEGEAPASRTIRDVARRVLEQTPDGWRADALRFDAGRLRLTYGVPMSILGLAPLALEEEPLDAGEGDVLVCFEPGGGASEAEFDDRRRLRLNGVRTVLILDGAAPCSAIRFADAVLCASPEGLDDVTARLGQTLSPGTKPPLTGLFRIGADRPPGPLRGRTEADPSAGKGGVREICDAVFSVRWRQEQSPEIGCDAAAADRRRLRA